MAPNSTGRSARLDLWLPLLRELTVATRGWAVWKNASSLGTGTGDVDTVAAVEEWPGIVAVHRRWAEAHGFGPVITCRHAWPGVMLLVAVDPSAGELVELDVVARCPFRGSTLFEAEALSGMLQDDPRGFRRLRPGAEGVFKLFLNGARWGGRPDAGLLREKGVAELVRVDEEGARQAAELFGLAAPAVRRAVHAVVDGGWDSRAVRIVEARAVALGARHPLLFARRMPRHLHPSGLCSVRGAIAGGRRVADLESWTTQAVAEHAGGWR